MNLMNLYQAAITPFGELGPNVSVSVYKVPASVKEMKPLVVAAVAQAPRLGLLIESGQAKVTFFTSPDAVGGLFAIGGLMEPDVFEKVHGVLMAIDGVEHVSGCGPGCSTLPRTAFDRVAVGASARAQVAKPWWKVW